MGGMMFFFFFETLGFDPLLFAFGYSSRRWLVEMVDVVRLRGGLHPNEEKKLRRAKCESGRQVVSGQRYSGGQLHRWTMQR